MDASQQCLVELLGFFYVEEVLALQSSGSIVLRYTFSNGVSQCVSHRFTHCCGLDAEVESSTNAHCFFKMLF